jgi:L-2-hydroxyglutarate oxidase LhgO
MRRRWPADRGHAGGQIPTAYYAKGNYFTLSGRSPFSRLIYPVPGARRARACTSPSTWAARRSSGPTSNGFPGIDYTVDPHRADKFYAAVRKYWPGLKDGALQPGYAGIRPRSCRPGAPAQDFTIRVRRSTACPA